MYQTLTHGFGQMAPQSWMVPEQKYDVIHYIREAYLKPRQPVPVRPGRSRRTSPACRTGDTRGPRPTAVEPWVTMDYGPSLAPTCEVGDDGVQLRLQGHRRPARRRPRGRLARPGLGRLRPRHAPPRRGLDRRRGSSTGTGSTSTAGTRSTPGSSASSSSPTRPAPAGRTRATGTFDDPRLRGRDGRPYGPLPRSWAHYRGLYRHGDKVILAYTVGQTDVLEMPGVEMRGPSPVFTRTFNLGPRETPMVLQVARGPGPGSARSHPATGPRARSPSSGRSRVRRSISPREAHAGPVRREHPCRDREARGLRPVPRRLLHRRAVPDPSRREPLLPRRAPGRAGSPAGRPLFVRNGRLVFDIGWVGALESKRRVDDGEWHEVAVTYEHATGRARLFIDGRRDGEKDAGPQGVLADRVVRIGFTAPDFPRARLLFRRPDRRDPLLQAGPRARRGRHGHDAGRGRRPPCRPLEARRRPGGGVVRDETGHGHDGTRRPTGPRSGRRTRGILAGISPPVRGIAWSSTARGRPAARRSRPARSPSALRVSVVRVPARGTRRPWPRRSRAAPRPTSPPRRAAAPRVARRSDDHDRAGRRRRPFAVDVLTPPETQPLALPDAPLGLRLLRRAAARSPSAPGTATSGASTGSTTRPAA